MVYVYLIQFPTCTITNVTLLGHHTDMKFWPRQRKNVSAKTLVASYYYTERNGTLGFVKILLLQPLVSFSGTSVLLDKSTCMGDMPV